MGNFVASFPAVTFGPLDYRYLERDKIRGLKCHKDNFEAKISLSSKAVSEIRRWINSIGNSCHQINNISNPHITIHTDASLTGWRIINGISPSRSLRHKAEVDHINVLELKAIETGICTYCKDKISLHE